MVHTVRALALLLALALARGTTGLQAPERTAAVIEGPAVPPQSTAAPSSSARSSTEHEVRCVTYNVWGFPDWLSPASSQRYRLIRERLAALLPDVVALQEVWCEAALAAVPSDGTWTRVRGRNEAVWLHRSGLVTATRHHVREAASHHFRAEADGPGALVTSRGALYAAIEWPDGRIGHVWNTHLAAGSDDSVRLRQARELIGWMRAARASWLERFPGEPPFLCLLGDLNCTPDSAPFRELLAWLEEQGPTQSSYGLAPTYDATVNLWARDGAPRAIDHGMVSAALLETFSADRLFATGDPAFGGRHLSDHIAARISFSLAPAPLVAEAATRDEGDESAEPSGVMQPVAASHN